MTQHKQRLTENCLTTGMKSQACITTAFTVVPMFGQRRGHHTRPLLEHCSMQQTSLPAATANECLRNHFNADGNTKFRSLLRQKKAMTRAVLQNPSARVGWLLAGIIDRALHPWGHVLPLTVGLVTTITQTLGQTRPYHTTTTTILPPLPVNRLCLCSHQASSCASLLPWGSLLPLF